MGKLPNDFETLSLFIEADAMAARFGATIRPSVNGVYKIMKKGCCVCYDTLEEIHTLLKELCEEYDKAKK